MESKIRIGRVDCCKFNKIICKYQSLVIAEQNGINICENGGGAGILFIKNVNISTTI
jgi:hypothetical protein